jgi:hypothetical protein
MLSSSHRHCYCCCCCIGFCVGVLMAMKLDSISFNINIQKKKTQLCHILFFSTRATKRKFFPRELCLDCWVCWVDVSSFHMFIFSKDFNLKSGENVISATLEQHKIIAIFRLKKEDSSNVNDDLSWDERYW